MSLLRSQRLLYRQVSFHARAPSSFHWHATSCLRRTSIQTRGKHNPASRRPSKPIPEQSDPFQDAQDVHEHDAKGQTLILSNDGSYQWVDSEAGTKSPKFRIRFLSPAIWAISVSSGIYVSLAYLEAKKELEPVARNPFGGNFQPRRQTPPTPTEVVTRAWDQLNPMSKLSLGIIGANGAVHLSSFLLPGFWNTLWHTPIRNVNYTILTSTFVHSGPFHLFFNMWACYNFLPPVGYSHLFRGDTHHMLSFFLSAGLLSGFAQHAASSIFKNGRGISSVIVPSGGASGALFAVFGAFCMQYPEQGVGIIFVPFYVDAQYFLPAIMLFDLVGMVRGYSFANLGHAVCYRSF